MYKTVSDNRIKNIDNKYNIDSDLDNMGKRAGRLGSELVDVRVKECI